MYIVIKEALGDTNTDTNFSMLLDADTLDKNNNNNNNNKTTTTTQSLGKRRRQQQQRPDDFSDWPDNDHAGNFKRIPKKNRTTPIQGFYAGLENTNSRENGIFKANVVQPYPPVPQSGITHIGDRNALYTTGQLETGLGITSPVIRGDTDDMSVPNLEGTDFDNVRPSKKYGKPYVPLTQQEKDQLISQVDTDRRVPNITYRRVPNITGDFDNMQSAGKSRRRTRKGRTRKTRKKRRSKKSTKKKRVKRVKKTRRKRGGADNDEKKSNNSDDDTPVMLPRPVLQRQQAAVYSGPPVKDEGDISTDSEEDDADDFKDVLDYMMHKHDKKRRKQGQPHRGSLPSFPHRGPPPGPPPGAPPTQTR